MRASLGTTAAAPELPGELPAGLRVLLLDGSSATARAEATLLLQQCLYAVTPASSATAALQALEGSPRGFDLLIADAATLGLRLSALEAPATRLLAAARGAGLPLLLMGDSPGADQILAGMRIGATDFLERPLSVLKLQNMWQHVGGLALALPPAATAAAAVAVGPAADAGLEGLGLFSGAFDQEVAFADGLDAVLGPDAAVLCTAPYGSDLSSLLLMQALELEDCGHSSQPLAAAPLLPPLQPAAPASPRESTIPLPGMAACLAAPLPPALAVPPAAAPPPRPESRAASSSRTGGSSHVSFERSRSGSVDGHPGAAAAAVSPRLGGSKRKGKDSATTGSAASSACAVSVSLCGAPSAMMMMAAAAPGLPRIPFPAHPAAATAMRPWQGAAVPYHTPLPLGQVWGQPMNPAAVAPGITPPVAHHHATAAAANPMMPPWGVPGMSQFASFPGVPMMPPPPMHHGGMMMPGMMGMHGGMMMPGAMGMGMGMGGMMGNPYLPGGGFGAGMMPPMMHHQQPLPMPQPLPQQQPPVRAMPAPLLASPAPASAASRPPAPPAWTPPAAVALPVDVIMSACRPRRGGAAAAAAAKEAASQGLLGDDAGRDSHLSSYDDVDLFMPDDADLGGGKFRKISSSHFLPSLELLLWEDLDDEDLDELSEGPDGGGSLDGLAAPGDSGGRSSGGKAGGDAERGSPGAEVAGGGVPTPLGLKLKKSLSLAVLIEMSLSLAS